MLEALRGCWKVPDLRRRILFTFGIIAIYRLGATVPVPGVKVEVIQRLVKQGGILGFLDLFAGGALSNFAVFALGIMPYITASIIMQLLRVVVPKIEEWAKEGEVGQRKITQWTRYMTFGLAVVESIGYTYLFENTLRQAGAASFTGFTRFLIIVTLIAGTVLIMWLGELITNNGIGNGMSILIFISIISRFPSAIGQTISINSTFLVAVVAIFLLVVVAVIFMEQGQRKVPVQYAKRVVGRKMYGGGMTYIPLKINSAGVIPIIFASSVLIFPAQFARFLPGKVPDTIVRLLNPGSGLYLILFALLIIFFTYFYTAIIFNPVDTADYLKKYGGFIPGVRPGKPTAGYVNNILNRITLPGSVFLALLAVFPSIVFNATNVVFFQFFGGISLLIIVGVALDTVQQLESQLVMRHYKGFLK